MTLSKTTLDTVSPGWLPLQPEMWLLGQRPLSLLPIIYFYFIPCSVTSSPPPWHAHIGFRLRSWPLFGQCVSQNQGPHRALLSAPNQGRYSVLTHELQVFLVSAERFISARRPNSSIVAATGVPTEKSCINSPWEIRCWNIVLCLESGYALVITLLTELNYILWALLELLTAIGWLSCEIVAAGMCLKCLERLAVSTPVFVSQCEECEVWPLHVPRRLRTLAESSGCLCDICKGARVVEFWMQNPIFVNHLIPI